MTFDPYYIEVDGKTLGDYACMIEESLAATPLAFSVRRALGRRL